MRGSTTAMAAGLLLATGLLLAAATDETPRIPGGEEVKKAVETRRGKTELSRLAAAMKPGTWAELKTDMPAGLWRAPKPGRGLHIAGWTDDAHWDSRTGQLFYMGLRQTRRFIAYNEEKNAWRVIELPADHQAAGSPHLENQFGHIYGNNAFDPENSRFYHMYHGGRGIEVQDNQPGGTSFYDVRTGKWTRVAGGLSMTGCIEYFTARKGLVAIDRGGLKFLADGARQWQDLGKTAVCGYHSLARHNPFRQEVLFAGGNQSPNAVARLTRDGKVESLKDCPVPLNTRADKITIDPVSGRYLVLRSEDRKFYEFDSDANQYRLIDDFSTTPWPFGRYDMPVVAFIPEYGVTVWADSKVWLYKHDAPAGTKP